MLASPKSQSNQGSFWSITYLLHSQLSLLTPPLLCLGLLPPALTIFVRSEEGIEDWWVQGLHKLGLYQRLWQQLELLWEKMKTDGLRESAGRQQDWEISGRCLLA